MPTEILLVGAGGHAKVVYATLQLQIPGVRVRLVDHDRAREQNPFFDIRVEAVPADLSKLPSQFHVSIGNNEARKKVTRDLLDKKLQLLNVIHPQAVVSKLATIEDGAFIAALALVAPATQIGRGAIINHAAVVDHDNVIEAFAHIAPHATLGGGVHVGECALVGAGAVVLPGLTIGRNAIVGAGAVVTRNVPDDTTVVGMPAGPRPC